MRFRRETKLITAAEALVYGCGKTSEKFIDIFRPHFAQFDK